MRAQDSLIDFLVKTTQRRFL